MLATQVCELLQEMGHSEHTVNTEYDRIVSICLDINRFGSQAVDKESLQKFVDRNEDRLFRGEISAAFHRHILLTVRRILTFIETGNLKWEVKKKGSRKYPVSDYCQKCLDGFIATKDCSKSSVNGMISACKRHMYWLSEAGIHDFKDVTPVHIKDYIVSTMNIMTALSAKSDLTYLRHFYQYLDGNDFSRQDFKMLLSTKISVKREIKPAISGGEVTEVLGSIDRATEVGKRNYAMILLGAITGLRGSDVVGLRLSDIDWKNGELRVSQSKTGKPVILPLTKDVGEAIKDYVLTGRPSSDSENVFLRTNSPFQGFSSSSALNSIYRQCFKEAGLLQAPGDHRSFHSLRRSLGLNMVVSGVPVTMVAQVLGHSNITSTRQYIALDSRHLKECALDFTGIEVRRKQIC